MKTKDFKDRAEQEKNVAAAAAAVLDDFWSEHKDELKDISAISWSRFRKALVEKMTPVLKAAAMAAAEQLNTEADIQADGDALQNEIDSWAETRAGELADGVVQTTKDELDSMDPAEEGFSDDASKLFDDVRAGTIGVTETTEAVTGGTAAALAAAGLEDAEAIWMTSADELVCEDCDDLDGLPATEMPPLHPNCRCWISYDVVVPQKSAIIPFLRWAPIKGGAGSGNFEHEGRPGEVGGSGEGGGVAKISQKTVKDWTMGGHTGIMGSAINDIADGKADKNSVIKGIRAETDGEKIYRGIGIKTSDDATNVNHPLNWKEGQEVQLYPQSFSKDENTAVSFARANSVEYTPTADSEGHPFEERRYEVRQSKTGVVFVVDRDGGAPVHGIDVDRHLSIEKNKWKNENEVISGGKFKVSKIETRTDPRSASSGMHESYRYIHLTQIGIF